MRRAARFSLLFLLPFLAAAGSRDAHRPYTHSTDALAETLIRFRAGQIALPPRTPKEAAEQLRLLHALDDSVRARIQQLENASSSGKSDRTPPDDRHDRGDRSPPPTRIISLLRPVTPAAPAQAESGPALSIPTTLSAPVRAGCSGRVLYAGPFRSYGQLAILDCDGDVKLVLGGLDRLGPQVGSSVRRGQIIGTMPHDAGPPPRLYVEVRQGETRVDPEPFFKAAPPAEAHTRSRHRRH